MDTDTLNKTKLYLCILFIFVHIKKHKVLFSLIEELLHDETIGEGRDWLLWEFYRKSKDKKHHEVIRSLFFHPDFRGSLDNENWMQSYWKKTDPALYALWKESNKQLRYKKYPKFFP